ncbi:MAG: hypothetical protein LBK13_12885 [Spirochaetales bacterium]|jgi:hypothetical protein|nr:hypothetical protein [Spirochaetales bacterium]
MTIEIPLFIAVAVLLIIGQGMKKENEKGRKVYPWPIRIALAAICFILAFINLYKGRFFG